MSFGYTLLGQDTGEETSIDIVKSKQLSTLLRTDVAESIPGAHMWAGILKAIAGLKGGGHQVLIRLLSGKKGGSGG